MNKYDYRKLREAAENDSSAVNALGSWFYLYGWDYWNGEYFDADGMKVVPQYETDEYGDAKLIGFCAM